MLLSPPRDCGASPLKQHTFKRDRRSWTILYVSQKGASTVNIFTTYVAPVFIGFTAFLTSLAMSSVTGVSTTFAFVSGLVSGILIAMLGIYWMIHFHNKYKKP